MTTVESFTSLSSSFAHALNNILSALYAASGYIELIDSPIAKRAGSAVNKAIAAGKALSCAMFLTSMDKSDGVGILNSPDFFVRYEQEILGKLGGVLHEAANVEMDAQLDTRLSGCVLSVDYDTLEALLVCAAYAQRRTAGGEASIVVRLSFARGDSDSAEFVVPGLESSMNPNRASGLSTHPCEMALEYPHGLFQALSINVSRQASGAIAIYVPITKAALDAKP